MTWQLNSLYLSLGITVIMEKKSRNYIYKMVHIYILCFKSLKI